MKSVTTPKFRKALVKLPASVQRKARRTYIDEYEERNYFIDAPDPITAIRVRMEELELKQKDLVGLIGSKGIVSEVLNRKRKFTVEMIRNLSEKLKITANVLIQDYELEK
jgi:HTH-type transcriptional regulator/antitoxin HigA